MPVHRTAVDLLAPLADVRIKPHFLEAVSLFDKLHHPNFASSHRIVRFTKDFGTYKSLQIRLLAFVLNRMANFSRYVRFREDDDQWDNSNTTNTEAEELCLLLRGFMPTIQIHRDVLLVPKYTARLDWLEGEFVRFFGTLEKVWSPAVQGSRHERLGEVRKTGDWKLQDCEAWYCNEEDCYGQFNHHACVMVRNGDEVHDVEREQHGKMSDYLSTAAGDGRFDLGIDAHVRDATDGPGYGQTVRYEDYKMILDLLNKGPAAFRSEQGESDAEASTETVQAQ